MDKQREEFEKNCGIYEGVEFSSEKEKYIPTYYGENAYKNATNQNALFSGWKAAQAAMQPEIDKLNNLVALYDRRAHESHATPFYDELQQLLSAANQRIQELLDLVEVVERSNKQLEANLNQVRSTYNQIIAEDTATRNEYLDEIAKLEERIRVADAAEPVLWMFTVDGRYYTAKSKAHADSMLNHPDTHLYPDKPEDFPLSPLYLHAPIPAEVELKAKIAELENKV